MTETIMAYLDAGNYGYVFLFIAISIVINFEKILSTYSTHRKRRLDSLERSVSIESLDERLKRHLHSEIEIETFYLTHGVRVSRVLLNGMLDLNEIIGTRVSFKHIIRCSRLLPNLKDVHKENFQITIDKFDKLYAYYNLGLGLPGFIGGIIWFAYSISQIVTSPNYPSLIVSCFTVLVSFAMLFQGAPYISTQIINRELRDLPMRESV
ncbi:hypothetical protein LUR59_004635 [Vibrio parahaemolyticus]|uniref:hypothetical protein n=1 Tax=Vibrio parahaemolyticus TaxID=670 RepID=UPI0004D7B423|nr:hypothetical protein [Vibrio parahaemolyticus]EIQ1514440.1 hypothetical protein [Vibrio parahaemolyticus]EJT1887605.1 hypothetical protein [Vibrio parahaemolyticus]ELB2775256.1 hypothetical protein [Vibrio parahaemolyticus]MCG6451543.1 hypothetical protein [Vibrio parahaemolyticus]MDF4839854.1 hypothetical protein [Vibrio parahaemolyticus]